MKKTLLPSFPPQKVKLAAGVKGRKRRKRRDSPFFFSPFLLSLMLLCMCVSVWLARARGLCMWEKRKGKRRCHITLLSFLAWEEETRGEGAVSLHKVLLTQTHHAGREAEVFSASHVRDQKKQKSKFAFRNMVVASLVLIWPVTKFASTFF